MGCVSSRQKGCCHCHCKTPYCSLPKSYSMHVHHPPQSKGDSYHVVALTSTTLGSLNLVSHNHTHDFSNGKIRNSDGFRIQNNEKEEETEANSLSNMIEQKLPKAISKTPTTTTTTATPTCDLETTINTWELMEGLEDTTPFQSPNHFKESFSCDVNLLNIHVDPPNNPSFIENDGTEEASNSNVKAEVKVSDIDDPDHVIVPSFQESLQEKQEIIKGFSFDEKKISIDDVVDFKHAPYGKEKVVLYFTSLRGVRKTYEDCCNVRLILKGLGMRVDERDVSMHLGFKEELKKLLGNEYGKGGLGLPRVFVGRKKYIGGAQDIQKLHEEGKLEKLLDSCERVGDIEGGDAICEACGNVRFIPCDTCYGSCKIYYEGDDDHDHDDGEIGEFGFQHCPDCNENGLIHCPMCYY